MAQVTKRDILRKTLEKLNKDEFHLFKNQMFTKPYRDRSPASQSQVKNAKHPCDVVNVLISHHTEDHAHEVVQEILEDISRNDLVRDLQHALGHESKMRKRSNDDVDGSSNKVLKREDKVENEGGFTLSDIEKYVDSHRKKLVENLEAKLEESTYQQLRKKLAQKTLKHFQLKSEHVYNIIDNIDKCIPDAGPIKLTKHLIDAIVNLLFKKTSTGGQRTSKKTISLTSSSRAEKPDPRAHGQQGSFTEESSDEETNNRSIDEVENPRTGLTTGEEEDGLTPKESSRTLDSGIGDNTQVEFGDSVDLSGCVEAQCTPSSLEDKGTEAKAKEPESGIAGEGKGTEVEVKEPENGRAALTEENSQSFSNLTPGSPQQSSKQKSKMDLRTRMPEAIEKWIEDKVKNLNSKEPEQTVKKSLLDSLNKINRREHEDFRCLLTEDTMVYTDPINKCSAILKIVFPKKTEDLKGNIKKATHFKHFYNSRGFSKEADFSLQFTMGVIGSITQTDVYFHGAEEPLVTATYKEEKFASFIDCFKRCVTELLVPVIALYKDVQNEEMLGKVQDSK